MVKYFVLTLLISFAFFFKVEAAKSTRVSKQKYDDFYSRQLKLKRQNEARERGRLSYIKTKKKQEKNYNKIQSQFAKQQKAQDQEKKDRFAEKWMKKQDDLHTAKMEKARKKFINSNKVKYKFQIPESEEYDIKIK